MEQNSSSSNKKYIVLLLAVIGIALILSSLLQGKLDISSWGKTITTPTDEEDNLEYGKTYHPSSAQLLQRDGIVVKNFGTELKAQDLESGVCVKAGNMKSKSKKSIVRFSEYAGYFYMYDGKGLSRITVNDPEKVSTTIKSCLKYEPMGNYIYSMRKKDGSIRLFRCSITGADEKLLFKESILDFWASDGNLLLKKEDGQYYWYNVVSGENKNHILPEDIHAISLDENQIYYLNKANSPDTVLYRRACDGSEDTALPFSSVVSYHAANGNIGFLLSQEDGTLRAAWCHSDGSNAVTLESKSFPAESSVDISPDHLYVTEPDGSSWVTSLDTEGWSELFADEEAN
jgi:hypothetical protein